MKNEEKSGVVLLLRQSGDINTEFAIESMGGSELLYEKLIRNVTRRIPLNIENMDKSLHEDGGLKDFAISIHGVKGFLTQAGCLRHAAIAEELEQAAKDGNAVFCAPRYEYFKSELIKLCGQLNAAIETVFPSNGAEKLPKRNIDDFLCELEGAEAAASAYDSLAASEIILPLTRLCFGGETDNLIRKAAAELDDYRPRQAASYLTELLNICENKNKQIEYDNSETEE